VKETEEKEKMEGIHSGTSSNSSKPSSQPWNAHEGLFRGS
jgi:hypothetical protein